MIKEGLTGFSKPVSSQKSSISKRNIVGKVFGVVLNENTPSPELFDAVGGWNGLGSVFYIDYEQSKNVESIDLKNCAIAKPLFASQKDYPLIGELIFILELPGANTQLINQQNEKYYVTSINIWNNIHHNAQPASNNYVLGKTFTEKTNINTLHPFEGDRIWESRFGSSIRFSSTCRDPNKTNYWSNSGKDSDPILIISNALKFDLNSTKPHLEDINKDGSSIVFTSSQTIPLDTNKTTLNALTKPIDVDKYNDTQIIFNSNRLVFSTKQDDMLFFARTNIEMHAKNVINIQSNERIHLNSSRNFIGQKSNGTLPDEPLLLGDKTITLMDTMLKEMINFCSILSTAVSTPAGSPILEISQAAQGLSIRLEELLDQTNDLKSTQNYTA